jgi:general secretion pathway protein M
MSTLTQWRQQAVTRLQPAWQRYQELQPRERLMVAVCAAVVALTLIYLLLWEPLANARSSAQANLAQQRATAQRLEVIAATVQKARASGQGQIIGRDQSLLTLVDQLAKSPQLGKAPTRLQPEGEQEVRIVFEDVGFDALASWLSMLETQYAIHVTAADFERRAGAGLVNARLTVQRP